MIMMIKSAWWARPKVMHRLQHARLFSLYTVVPRIIAEGILSSRGRLFREGRRLFEGGDYFKYCSLEVEP